ncbi:hypothetical protein ANO14919_136610 [Xylariales sp. No.14919]|nr:hypothetical protein ANO14919_136610 [Xylariales sp. No.14919]
MPTTAVVSSASSQKTAVVESESEFSPPPPPPPRDQGRRQVAWRPPRTYPPAYPAHPLTAYFPSGTHLGAAGVGMPQHRLESASESTIQGAGYSCGGVPGWQLCVHGDDGSSDGGRSRSRSRTSHAKGTACVVLAIALIFVVVLVLGLVSNKEQQQQQQH